MEVIRAECAGACYGVCRALDMAHEAVAAGGSVQTLGSLIHNPRVVAELAESGVTVCDDPARATADTIVIRSHGASPDTIRELTARGVRIVDATCPHVIRAQRAAERLAREGAVCVVVGEADHPEVQGIRSYALDAGGRVICAVDAAGLPDDIADPVGIVVQTTQERAVFDAVFAALRDRGLHPIVCDTICSATSERQQAAAELAGTVDAVVVVGGHNSSNTTRLFEICQRRCPRTFHVETPDELNADDFIGCDRVGVTAGASTPDEQIEAVVSCLQALNG